MAKGAAAKEEVAKTIISAFGDKYLGESGGKYFVLANDNGEDVQIAISLTCPKTQISDFNKKIIPNVEKVNGGWDFEEPEVAKQPPEVNVTQSEKDNITRLMKKLSLI